MASRKWRLSEEQFIIDHADSMTAREIADALCRSYSSVRNHIQFMQYSGKMDKKRVVYGTDHWISNLRVCPSCLTPRESFRRDGICSVCHKKESLEEHERKMHMAYENLPRELKDRTNGTFRIERNRLLMTKSKNLREPRIPDTVGMDAFETGMAMEEYYIEHERYELARLTLDVDAVKQRRSKWLRKAKKWREERGVTDGS